MPNHYMPNIAVHPGQTLQDILESSKMTQIELAKRTGLASKTVNEIVQEKSPITPDTAIKLSEVFGMSTTFWNNLQENYVETVTRIKEQKQLEAEISNLKNFNCYDELVKWGYIKKVKDQKEKVKNLLNFFGVSSLNLVLRIHSVVFRLTGRKQICKESIACWLRCGEIEAKKIITEQYGKNKLVDSLSKLRALTKKPPNLFPKELIETCASFGVAVSLVPYFKKTYVNGATRWLNPNKAIIQLSLKGSYDDIFWFTFFHELAHILKHGKKDQFIEFKDRKNVDLEEKEREANELAAEILIPKVRFNEFVKKANFSNDAIKKFAGSINIAPSIVAGRLSYEYDDWQRWSYLRNRLKFANA